MGRSGCRGQRRLRWRQRRRRGSADDLDVIHRDVGESAVPTLRIEPERRGVDCGCGRAPLVALIACPVVRGVAARCDDAKRPHVEPVHVVGEEDAADLPRGARGAIVREHKLVARKAAVGLGIVIVSIALSAGGRAGACRWRGPGATVEAIWRGAKRDAQRLVCRTRRPSSVLKVESVTSGWQRRRCRW